MKKKLILDLFLFIIMILLMNYSFTGNLFHEILGIIIIILFIWHNYKNIIWIKRVTVNIIKKEVNSKLLINYIVDVVLWISFILVTISGIFISQDLFAFLNITYNTNFYNIHLISAYALMIAIVLHVLLHFKMIVTFIERTYKIERKEHFKYLCLFIFISFSCICFKNILFKTSNISNSTSNYNTSSSTNSSDSSSDDSDSYSSSSSNDDESYNSSTGKSSNDDESYNSSSSGDNPTLTDYLSTKNCSNCGHHCLLSAIRCGRGSSAKAEATTEYNELYG